MNDPQALALRKIGQEHPTNPSARSDRSDLIPACPVCGKTMVLRTAQKGKSAGRQFWGCSGHPDCKGMLDI